MTIRGQQLTAASVKAIMTSPRLTEGLSSLFLPESTIGDDGLVVLAASPAGCGNRYSIGQVGATAAGVEVLASSPYLQPKDLDRGTNVGDAGAVAPRHSRSRRSPRGGGDRRRG